MITKASVKELQEALKKIKTEFVNVELDEKKNKITFIAIDDGINNKFDINKLIV